MNKEKDAGNRQHWLEKLRSKKFKVRPGDSQLVRFTKNSGFWIFLVFLFLITLTLLTAVVAVL